MIAGLPGEDSNIEPERPRWMDWVEKNAGPKIRKIKIPKRQLTRWQKRGPMTDKDKMRFLKWAAKNAIARHMRKVNKPKKVTDPREERRKRLQKKLPLEERLKRTPDLAEPRWPREKYLYPPLPDHPFTPHIRLNEAQPFPERGRPRIGAYVPREFQHWEIEAEFWATTRFAVHPSTKSYKPSSNIQKLAVPRVVPPLVPHCPMPEPAPEIVPKRRRFTPRQWKKHQAKLSSYLARPRPLFNLDDILYMQELQLRLKP